MYLRSNLYRKFNFINILIIQWFICILFNYFYTGSKFNHFHETYAEYLSRKAKLEKSAFKARDYLVSHTDHVLFNKSVNYLCVAVLSKNRVNSPVNYVNQAVMSLITRIKMNQKENLSIVLYNVEDNPNDNKYALELNKLIQVESLSSNVNFSNVRVKEAADYALVIRKLYAKECNYQLILEDDIIAQLNWFDRIKSIIDFIESNKNKAKCLVVKLFTGYNFFDWDWAMDWNVWLQVFSISFIILFFTHFFVTSLTTQRINKISFILILINSVGIVSFCYAASTEPLKRHGVREYSTGFGTAAVLFNRNNSILFANYLEEVVDNFLTRKSKFFKHKDLLIETFRRQNNLIEFIAEPSVFQHQGMHSSLEKRDLSLFGFLEIYKSYSFLDDEKLISNFED